MKIQFIGFTEKGQPNMGNLGISRLCSFLKQEFFEVDVQHLYVNSDMEEEINKIDFSCDVLGFTTFCVYMDFTLAVIKEVKRIKPTINICLGGTFAGIYAHTLLSETDLIDGIILGHGEYVFRDILNDIKNGISFKDAVKRSKHAISCESEAGKTECYIDIKQLPWPDRGYLKTNPNIIATICESHGCTGHCSFCQKEGGFTRWTGRDPQDIVAEIKYIYETTGIRLFNFVGSSFEDPGGVKGKERIKTICNLILEYPVRFSFRCNLRAESFEDCETDIQLIHLMKQAGIQTVLIGIESGSAADLSFYNKRATVDDNHRALRLFNQCGIDITPFGFITLNPYTNAETLSQNYDFLSQYMTGNIRKYVSRLMLTYHSPAYNKIYADKLLDSSFSWRSPFAYRYADAEAEEVFEFINGYIDPETEIFFLCWYYEKMQELFFMTRDILDLSSISKDFYRLMDESEALCSDFFYNLYKIRNIELCAKKVRFFLDELTKCYKKSFLLHKKILKKVMGSL